NNGQRVKHRDQNEARKPKLCAKLEPGGMSLLSFRPPENMGNQMETTWPDPENWVLPHHLPAIGPEFKSAIGGSVPRSPLSKGRGKTGPYLRTGRGQGEHKRCHHCKPVQWRLRHETNGNGTERDESDHAPTAEAE